MSRRLAWTATVIAILIVSMPGAAHNFLGVYDGARTVTHNDYGDKLQVYHCDGVLSLCSSSPDYLGSPFNGFAFLDGRDEFLVHVDCSYEFRETLKGYHIETWTWATEYYSEYDPTCEEVVYPSQTLVKSETAHEAVSIPDDAPNVEWTERIHVESTLTTESWSISEKEAWVQTWIQEAPMRSAATLSDGSAEDTYADIRDNASVYVIHDPSGDDSLYVGGVELTVTDGVPVTAGDVVITRMDEPNGKNWTIEHTDDLPFSARIEPVSGARETQIKTFSI